MQFNAMPSALHLSLTTGQNRLQLQSPALQAIFQYITLKNGRFLGVDTARSFTSFLFLHTS
jgi:hypothetical protein